MLDPYREPASDEMLFRQIHDHLKQTQTSLRGALLCVDGPDINIVDHFRRKLTSVDSLWSTSVGECLLLQDTGKRADIGPETRGRVLLLPTRCKQVFLIVTLDSSHFVNALLFPLIDQCRPRVSLPFITSKALVKLLSVLPKKDNLKAFEITHLAVRSRIEGRNEGRKVRFERIWTEEPLEDVLDTLRERGQWIHSVEFNYYFERNEKPVEHAGHISRRCTFRSRGEFDWFRKNALDPLLDEAAHTLEFYSKRSRVESPDKLPRPIVIEYPQALFHDKAQNRRLIEALRKLPRASMSVIHGNPYLRAAIVDFTDGSSYEVWVLSENRVIISPQFRATFASVERVCDHILSRFAEGELKDLREANA